ncbi:type I DNA topoisomerase [Leptospira licerasiae]|uniref:DNA topoisomerase 1 n=1 Tax=Leptospira licerasiae str. MMD4847 TaxID=1049971 RepID=A0ABN0H7Y7_9LEPT|nr:type I DNA topoisomerase [Leptospira licerasiae]EIE00011.1 DNA topoisomerase I [Leptospira licerasiae serovar Varillal str. VAR 010]EJZ41763.1 DNA topoisomerase I [Leptospira licerasiae str. MMD4847]
MSVLVIVESPTKVKTISSYLGKEYKVLATFGHILDLPPDRIGIKIEKDFEPEYVPLKGKKKILSSILKEAKLHSSILIATDPDREGEFIGYILAQKLGKKANISRIRFQEIQKDKILQAISEPDEIDLNLVDSQKARRILDRLIGYKVSPFLWRAVSGEGLSAGRVQSVALKWICEREEEIRSFVPVITWLVSATVFYGSGENEKIVFYPKRGAFSTQKAASEFLDSILKKTKVLQITERKEKAGETLPPPPFTTAALQQEAFRVLKFSASKTMKLAQELYEGTDLGKGKSQGLITYMRTDSVRIGEDARDSIRRKIGSKFGKEFISDKAQTYRLKRTKGRSQDAHEAIRPVDVFLEPSFVFEVADRNLSKDSKKLYELIWKRAVASQMRSEAWKRLEFVANVGEEVWEGEKLFTVDPGYKKIYNVNPDILPAWKKGETLKPDPWEIQEKTTEPPHRYTEASLVSKLEKEGIGRPSTFASILETLYKRKYVYSEKGKLYAETLGERVNTFLQAAFSDLFREKFTSEMEQKLDSIASGEESRSKVLSEFYSVLDSQLKKTNITAINKQLKEKPKTPKYGICPVCKEGERVRKKSSKKKEYYICSRFPACDYAEYI